MEQMRNLQKEFYTAHNLDFLLEVHETSEDESKEHLATIAFSEIKNRISKILSQSETYFVALNDIAHKPDEALAFAERFFRFFNDFQQVVFDDDLPF